MGYRKVYWEFGTAAKASAVQVYSAALNAGNFAAAESLRAAFESAVDAVSLGNDGSEQFIANETSLAKNPSTNPLAQRENKWLVSCIETGTGNAVTFTIPCADLSLLGEDGETMDTSLTEYTDLVSAVDDFVLSNDGVAVTVSTVKFRARTL
jgi:hypothetical protein